MAKVVVISSGSRTPVIGIGIGIKVVCMLLVLASVFVQVVVCMAV